MRENGTLWAILDRLTHSKKDASAGIAILSLLDLLAITNFLESRKTLTKSVSSEITAGLQATQGESQESKAETQEGDAKSQNDEARPQPDEVHGVKASVVELPRTEPSTDEPRRVPEPEAGSGAPRSNVRRLDWRRQWKAN